MKKKTSRPLKKRGLRRRMPIRRAPRRIVTNTASVRENYSVSVSDGTMTFFSTALSNLQFNRAQSVAESYQQFRIAYVKLMFRPSADTFPIAAGNTIPQLYFQMNKYQALVPGAGLNNLLDMGCRPIRFDDKNIARAWKPVVLLGTDTTSALIPNSANAVKVTPWLSTNAFANTPTAYAPSNVEHLGCVFFVTKPNPATPAINYTVDVEVVFQFRRPLSITTTSEPYVQLGHENVVVDLSGNRPLGQLA